jgi:hypothetical protein
VSSQGPAPVARIGQAMTGSAVVTGLNFYKARDTAFFEVKVSGGQVLRVVSMDCCVQGDHWSVTLINTTGGSVVGKQDPAEANCGDGSTTKWTGPVQMAASPYLNGIFKVFVSYCSGVNVFPAGMYLKFRYNGNMTVIRRA